MTKLAIVKHRSLWWAAVPLAPVMIVQGLQVLRKTTLLPDASGSPHGIKGKEHERCLRLGVIGDSTVAGVGVADHSQALAAQLAGCLAARLHCQVQWRAAGRTSATLAEVQRAVIDRLGSGMDVAVVACGVNDTVRLTSERAFRRSLRSIYEALRTRGARHVVFSSVPPVGRLPLLPQPLRGVFGARSSLLDAIMQEEAEAMPLSSHAAITFPPAEGHMAADGFHAGERGYAVWAAQLADHIRRLSPQTVALTEAYRSADVA